MRIVEIDDTKYIIIGSVIIQPTLDTEILKKQWNATTILKRDNKLYLCIKILDAEFKDITE